MLPFAIHVRPVFRIARETVSLDNSGMTKSDGTNQTFVVLKFRSSKFAVSVYQSQFTVIR